ncbi:MAG: sigma 54-interacting transcriptional regulator [Myxococcota bacterium]
MKEVLLLMRGDTVIQARTLEGRAIDVGSDPSCDMAAVDAGLSRFRCLIVPSGGAVRLYDLRRPRPRPPWVPLPRASSFELGSGFALRRDGLPDRTPGSPATERLRRPSLGPRPQALLLGRRVDTRVVRLDDRPLGVGSSADNDVVLSDRAVSRFHCRIEPADGGVVVRDLGSTNGTRVDGQPIRRHLLRPGDILRVGRTEMRVTGGLPTLRQGIDPPVVESAPMLDVMADVDRFARLPWPVLVCGETGVGKEVVARALHERSPRSSGPFVAINAGGLPAELVESELFGHERGAFTGAVQAHRGAFERAHGGTLFLDEVAELPVTLQTRLLRVLETWNVRRVGGESPISVNVRLVCATHRALVGMVQRGLFREDLFYRIHRLVLDVLPLRRRTADIEPLAERFLRSVPESLGEKELAPAALARLRGHSWPGNVRELRNAVELAAAITDGPCIDASVVDRILRRSAASAPDESSLRKILAEHGGNYAAAARAVGIPRSTLRDRLKSAESPDSGS